MPHPNEEASIGETEVLAVFSRRNNQTGAIEQVRITTNDYNGRQITHIRGYYQEGRPAGDDEGWRPTRQGQVIREHELDEAIAALQRAKAIVNAAGRSTSPAPPGSRNPRPRQVAEVRRATELMPWDKPGDRPTSHLSPRQAKVCGQVQANEAASRTTPPWESKPSSPREVQTDAFDDLAEYRR